MKKSYKRIYFTSNCIRFPLRKYKIYIILLYVNKKKFFLAFFFTFRSRHGPFKIPFCVPILRPPNVAPGSPIVVVSAKPSRKWIQHVDIFNTRRSSICVQKNNFLPMFSHRQRSPLHMYVCTYTRCVVHYR